MSIPDPYQRWRRVIFGTASAAALLCLLVIAMILVTFVYGLSQVRVTNTPNGADPAVTSSPSPTK